MKKEPKSAICKWCDKKLTDLKRHWRSFCSNTCRETYFSYVAQVKNEDKKRDY